MSREGRNRARQVALKRVGELGLNRKDLAERAGVSRNTVQTFLDGTTWPREITLAQIDKGLGFDPGTLKAIALSDDAITDRSDASDQSSLTAPSGAGDWVALLSDEERERMSPQDYAEISAVATAEALKRWREIDAARAERRGNSGSGNSKGKKR